jgi:hypothetical protein
MAMYKVKYAVNTLAHLGRIHMEDRIGIVESNVDSEDQIALMRDMKKSLSSLEAIPENQIKVLGWSQF